MYWEGWLIDDEPSIVIVSTSECLFASQHSSLLSQTKGGNEYPVQYTRLCHSLDTNCVMPGLFSSPSPPPMQSTYKARRNRKEWLAIITSRLMSLSTLVSEYPRCFFFLLLCQRASIVRSRLSLLVSVMKRRRRREKKKRRNFPPSSSPTQAFDMQPRERRSWSYRFACILDCPLVVQGQIMFPLASDSFFLLLFFYRNPRRLHSSPTSDSVTEMCSEGVFRAGSARRWVSVK